MRWFLPGLCSGDVLSPCPPPSPAPLLPEGAWVAALALGAGWWRQGTGVPPPPPPTEAEEGSALHGESLSETDVGFQSTLTIGMMACFGSSPATAIAFWRKQVEKHPGGCTGGSECSRNTGDPLGERPPGGLRGLGAVHVHSKWLLCFYPEPLGGLALGKRWPGCRL